MRHLFYPVLCLLSFVLAARAAEAYTNLAGKVIAATPVEVKGDRVVFEFPGEGRALWRPTRRSALPMSVFPSSEQKRIKAAAGVREMPGELKGLAAEIASQRARYEARARAGKLSQEKLAENLEMLAGGWRHAVGESNLSADEKAYWKENVP